MSKLAGTRRPVLAAEVAVASTGPEPAASGAAAGCETGENSVLPDWAEAAGDCAGA
jgi:hypothetical protein